MRCMLAMAKHGLTGKKGRLLDLKMTLRLVSQPGLSMPWYPHTRSAPEGLSRERNLDSF